LKIIGNIDGSTKEILRKFHLLEVTDVVGRVNHEKAIKIAKSSDLLLLLMGTTELTPKGWIPSKLIEYIACGKTILGIVPEGEAASIIRKTRTGFVVTSEDEEAIVNIIKKEYERKKAGIKSDIVPEYKEIDKYSKDYTITKFAELFNSISK
jgi:glycosyltransferase involved in cell wall biosynthesis